MKNSLQYNNEDVFKDIKSIPNESINTILSDPPYNLSSEWEINKEGAYELKGKAKDFMNKWDGLDGEQLNNLFEGFYRILKSGGYVILFGMDTQIPPFQYYALKNGFEIQQSLYWLSFNTMPKGRSVNFDTDIDLSAYKYGVRPLKQVLETIMVFKKPSNEKTFEKHLANSNESPSLWNIEKIKDEQYPSQLYLDKEGLEKVQQIYPKADKALKVIPYEDVELPFLYSNRASSKERNAGLDKPMGGSNTYNLKCKKCGKWRISQGVHKDKYTCKCVEPEWEQPEVYAHPTLKPIGLIIELANLFTLPKEYNQKWYVPFAGTGSEIIGLILSGIDPSDIRGAEANSDFHSLGMKRIKYFSNRKES